MTHAHLFMRPAGGGRRGGRAHSWHLPTAGGRAISTLSASLLCGISRGKSPMTYRNDPYDPKQAALLDQAALDDAVAGADKAFAAAGDLDALAALKPQHLGDRAPVSLARREIGALPPAAKADAGKRVNAARAAMQAAFDARLAALTAEREQRGAGRGGGRRHAARPDRRPRGARHPLTTLMERIGDLFVGMGYEVAEGPEAELEWATSTPSTSRRTTRRAALMDTFFVGDRTGSGLVLRTHTSPVQARTMLAAAPPIYVVVPGRVYRTDELDATHTPVFHQVEGLVVDKGITMAHLKGTLDHFARAMFGPGGADPLAAALLPVHRAVGRVRRVVRRSTATARAGSSGAAAAWSTRNVLRACGIDPGGVYSGFAFGMGIERALMFRNGGATCATWLRATCGSPGRSAWRCTEMRVPLSWLREHVDAARGPHRRRRWRRRWSTVGIEVEAIVDHGATVEGHLVVGRVRVDRGADRVQEADPVVPVDVGGTAPAAAGHHLRRPQLRRGRPGRGVLPGGGAARRVRDRRPQDLRAHLQRHDLLGPGARRRRRPRRDHRARPGVGRDAGRGAPPVRRAGRHRGRRRDHPGPGLQLLGAGHGPGAVARLRRARFTRPGLGKAPKGTEDAGRSR